MKRLHFVKPNNLNLLHEELLAKVPALSPIPDAEGRLQAIIQVEGRGDDIWLTVPDATDETAITAVVTSHDHTVQPPPTAESIRRTRIAELLAIPRSDWTVAQYRELLQLVAQEQVQ